MKAFPKQFSESQIARLADMSSDLGMVFTASVVLPTLMNEFSWSNLVYGSVCATGFIFMSFKLSK
jgi:hypothetical protein